MKLLNRDPLNRCPVPKSRGGQISGSTVQRFNGSTRGAFTLIEIMVVVAIIGLIAAMGIPSIVSSVQKEGMRKAVSDFKDVCAEARREAIFKNQAMAVIIDPAKGTFSVTSAPADESASAQTNNPNAAADTAPVPSSSSTQSSSWEKMTSGQLPDGFQFEMVARSRQDFTDYEWVKFCFYPNGTADEAFVIILDKNGIGRSRINIDFATGIAEDVAVDKE
ncbi:MAG TPA: type II secretion system protein [Verrucomicrobiae bacterium]|nr:type II secretion system protein [Verrucomicrobiae bacterium]